MVMRSADRTDTADAVARRSRSDTASLSLSLSKTCRRMSLLVICITLIIYSVVSTVTFLSWAVPESSTSSSSSYYATPTPIVNVEVASRRDQQRKINAALKQNMPNKSWANNNNNNNENENNNTTAAIAARNFPFTLRDREKSPPFAIFYNVYIPTDQGEEGVRRSLDIIREQIGQVGTSYAASFPGKPVTIFYNTIGKEVEAMDLHMAHFCADSYNVLCIHMQHYDEGFELLTLQSLYDYCRYHSDSDDRVVYAHNKGSYHSANGEADRVRRHLTMAVTNEKCLQPPDDSCSACGLRFFTVWSMQFPGNFFTTKCSYVRKLIPPKEFPKRLTAVFDLKRQKIEENPLYLEISPNFTAWAQEFGKGRYIATHWIGSHPSLVPCDLTEDSLDDWWWVNRQESDFSWGMIPRPTQKSHLHNKLLGNLFKWYNLYNEAPGDDSWAWRSFPDGAQWKAAVAQFGNRTVEITLEMERKKALSLAAPKNETVAIE